MNVVGDLINISTSVRSLWRAAQQPVSFIEPQGGLRTKWHPEGKTIAAVLDSVASGDPDLEWRRVGPRYVIYPKRESWNQSVSGVPTGTASRIDAADALVHLARAQHTDLADLAEPPIKGDPGSPVFADPVTLQPGQSILANFINLLGDNERLAFIVERVPSGVRVLYFHVVSAEDLS
jgi:hypothetical protein